MYTGKAEPDPECNKHDILHFDISNSEFSLRKMEIVNDLSERSPVFLPISQRKKGSITQRTPE